jgi:hypothetical protein
MHLSIKPLAIILEPSRKDISTSTTFEAILKLSIVHITIRIVVLSLALNRTQFPLSSVVLFRAESQFALTITMAVVEITFIYAAVTKSIFAHTKLAAIHEFAVKSLITCLIILLSLAML